jgi:hypothetical protein
MLNLSHLAHTWLIDLDGTVLLHNGHINGGDIILPGVLDFWKTIPKTDCVILMSAREMKYQEPTLDFLRKMGLWWTYAIFDLPPGERILLNDAKPSGLLTSIAINLSRNAGMESLNVNFDLGI